MCQMSWLIGLKTRYKDKTHKNGFVLCGKKQKEGNSPNIKVALFTEKFVCCFLNVASGNNVNLQRKFYVFSLQKATETETFWRA